MITRRLLPALLFLFFGLFLIYPIMSLLQGAFLIEKVQEGHVSLLFSLDYFRILLSNPFYRDCFGNSFCIAIVSTAGALALALPLAYIFERKNFPAKSILSGLLLVPLILPPFVGAIGMKQFLARFGSLNILLDHFGLSSLDHPIDWFGQGGFAGIIILEVLHLYPILFLGLRATLGNIDPSLREAGKNLGSSSWDLFWRVTFPLALPGIFSGGSIVFIAAFTDLGVPLMFDFSATVPSQIFNMVTQTDQPMGYALVVVTLVMVALLFVVGRQWGEGHAMISRSASGDSGTKLEGIHAVLVSVGVSALILISLLPHLGVVIQSLSARWFMSVLPAEWSGNYYREVCLMPLTLLSAKNSLWYATLSASLDLVIGTLIAYLLAREKFWGKSLLDVLAMLPLALPGLVSAFAYFITFTHNPIPPELKFWNQLWTNFLDPRHNPTFILVMAYAIHRLPYIVRAAYTGFQQTSITLEEASINLGSSAWRTLAKITLPLLTAHLIAGSILTFSFAVLDVSNGMMLANETKFYPLTKAIYALMGRILPTAPSLACALGVLAMIFLGLALWLASRCFGQKVGEMFRP